MEADAGSSAGDGNGPPPPLMPPSTAAEPPGYVYSASCDDVKV